LHFATSASQVHSSPAALLVAVGACAVAWSETSHGLSMRRRMVFPIGAFACMAACITIGQHLARSSRRRPWHRFIVTLAAATTLLPPLSAIVRVQSEMASREQQQPSAGWLAGWGGWHVFLAVLGVCLLVGLSMAALCAYLIQVVIVAIIEGIFESIGNNHQRRRR
jgi:hypothetical protein